MGIVQEQRIKMDSKDLRRPDGHGSKEADLSCQQCRQPLEEWEAGFCEGCGMTREIPRPTWPDCNGETHFSTANSMWRRGMEWRKCKRCDRHAENAVQFGPRVTNVYCQACTCNECGSELERYEETTCQACCEKTERLNQ